MNPRAAINDLLPFQGSPFGQLGYFSTSQWTPLLFAPRKLTAHLCFVIAPYPKKSSLFWEILRGCELMLRRSFLSPQNSVLRGPRFRGAIQMCNGEGGIRTHAPFRTNGFQDRLVMTTSIPLHVAMDSAFALSLLIVRKILSIFAEPFSGMRFDAKMMITQICL